MNYTSKTNGLIEITSVSIDRSLPQEERCAEFKRQIKDMHNYTSTGIKINAVYANNGKSIEDCLRGMMA
jgi:hypothetical protein